MAAQRSLKTYDFRQVTLVIGGFDIGGYGDDGGIDVEWGADVGEMSVGIDGEATFSADNNESATVTITVKETSRSYRDLAGLYTTQKAQRPIEALNFLMRDAINGDEVKDRFAAFLSLPGMSKGKTAGERVFVLALPNARANAKFGNSIA